MSKHSMPRHSTGHGSKAKKAGVLGLGAAAVGAAFVGLGSGTASADVELVAPSPQVTSRQATISTEGALRYAAYGQARGLGDSRSGDIGEVSAQGEVIDSAIAVPGTRAVPFNFNLNQSQGVNGPTGQKTYVMSYGPPLGTFGGAN